MKNCIIAILAIYASFAFADPADFATEEYAHWEATNETAGAKAELREDIASATNRVFASLDQKIEKKQDALPYPTNAIPASAIAGLPPIPEGVGTNDVKSIVEGEGYAKKAYADAAGQTAEGNARSYADTLDGLLRAWVLARGYLTDIPGDYAKKSWVSSQGYLTAIPDDYATKEFAGAADEEKETQIKAWADRRFLKEHQDITGKQDALVSGTNIKTVNGKSLLGHGNIEIQGGGGGGIDTNEIRKIVVELRDTYYDEDLDVTFKKSVNGGRVFMKVVGIGDHTEE